MKRLRLLLAILAPAGLALAIAACSRLNGAAPPIATIAGRLTVLTTGTVWANLEPCG